MIPVSVGLFQYPESSGWSLTIPGSLWLLQVICSCLGWTLVVSLRLWLSQRVCNYLTWSVVGPAYVWMAQLVYSCSSQNLVPLWMIELLYGFYNYFFLFTSGLCWIHLVCRWYVWSLVLNDRLLLYQPISRCPWQSVVILNGPRLSVCHTDPCGPQMTWKNEGFNKVISRSMTPDWWITLSLVTGLHQS